MAYTAQSAMTAICKGKNSLVTWQVAARGVDEVVGWDHAATLFLFFEVSEGVLAGFCGISSSNDNNAVQFVSFFGNKFILGVGSFNWVLEKTLNFLIGNSFEEGEILNEFFNIREVLSGYSLKFFIPRYHWSLTNCKQACQRSSWESWIPFLQFVLGYRSQ